MAKLNILVTGVGAIIGYGIVNSLRMTGRELNIVGMDVYPDAVGQHFCDHFVQAKYADSVDYLDFLFDVIDSKAEPATGSAVTVSTGQEILAGSAHEMLTQLEHGVTIEPGATPINHAYRISTCVGVNTIKSCLISA